MSDDGWEQWGKDVSAMQAELTELRQDRELLEELARFAVLVREPQVFRYESTAVANGIIARLQEWHDTAMREETEHGG